MANAHERFMQPPTGSSPRPQAHGKPRCHARTERLPLHYALVCMCRRLFILRFL